MSASTNTVNKESQTIERLKAEVLEGLDLMRPDDWQQYWKQVNWPKPDLVQLAKHESRGRPTPLAHGLRRLAPEILAQASAQPDPFAWLLACLDVAEWSHFCTNRKEPWMTRLWLATASQSLAERTLIHKAHGWGTTWEELRRNPDQLRKADEYYFAQLRHASTERRAELLAIPGLTSRLAQAHEEKDEAFLRRFRRAKNGGGKRAGVAFAEKYVVQHWLEMPQRVPGLCFFGDIAVAFHVDPWG